MAVVWGTQHGPGEGHRSVAEAWGVGGVGGRGSWRGES